MKERGVCGTGGLPRGFGKSWISDINIIIANVGVVSISGKSLGKRISSSARRTPYFTEQQIRLFTS
jgi:hypothetical protein